MQVEGDVEGSVDRGQDVLGGDRSLLHGTSASSLAPTTWPPFRPPPPKRTEKQFDQ